MFVSRFARFRLTALIVGWTRHAFISSSSVNRYRLNAPGESPPDCLARDASED